MSTNQVVVSPGVYTSEKDLSFVAASVGITSLGVAGETVRGPAFQPIFVGDYDTYTTYFGGQNTSVFTIGATKVPQFESTYIARQYLEESNNMYMSRALGQTGYDATEALVINVRAAVDGTQGNADGFDQIQSVKPVSAMTACVIRARKSTTSTGTYSQPNIAIGINVNGTFTPNSVDGKNPINAAGTALTGIGGAPIATFATNINPAVYGQWTDASSNFVVQAIQEAGTGVVDSWVVNFNPNSNNYILKVLGTDPYYDSANPDARLYVEQFYPKAMQEMGKSWGGSATYNYLNVLKDMSFYNLPSSWGNYTDTWQPIATPNGPTTPWIYSEVRGTEIVKLFRLITIADGDTANNFLKFSVVNIDIDNVTFDLAVRQYSDTDAKPVIFEQFRNLSMNPVSQNYIGKRIGTLNGDYPLRSRYIMVEMDENAPIDGLPSGYGGYPHTDYGNLSGRTEGGIWSTQALHTRIEPYLTYNVAYDTITDNIRKTYLGISSKTNYDQDIFNYKGCATAQSAGACATAWSGHTYGFHLDTRASGSTFLGGENLGDKKIWFSGSVGTFPFFTTSSQYTGTGCAGKYYGNGCEDLTNTTLNIYSKKQYRKFTVAPYGGHDGWDTSRRNRSNTDVYKENSTSYTPGYGSGTTTVANSGAYSFNKNTDWYSYNTNIQKYANPENVDINLFASPGIDYTNNLTLVNESIEMIEDDRADSLYLLTAENYKDQTIATAVDALDDASLDSNYTATYWPWIQYNDTENNVRIYIPPTAEVLRNMALTDNVSFPWFATAGYNRGIVKATRVRTKLTQDNRDDLYEARINPIATFTATGPVIWGNKTLQTSLSALDRINVRRLLLRARKLISAVAVRLVFEQNDEVVRQEFLSLVNPILEDIRRDRGLTDFRVVVSSDPEEIDQNKLTGKIYLKPTRSLEFIEIQFNVTPTATSFDDI